MSNQTKFKSLTEKQNLVLNGGLDPKTVIRGEKLSGRSKKERISLEITAENISVWSKTGNKIIYMYVFNRETKDICVADSSLSWRKIKLVSRDYSAAINSMKCHMSDLFMIYPNEMQILEAIDEIEQKNKISIHKFLRLLCGVLRNG